MNVGPKPWTLRPKPRTPGPKLGNDRAMFWAVDTSSLEGVIHVYVDGDHAHLAFRPLEGLVAVAPVELWHYIVMALYSCGLRSFEGLVAVAPVELWPVELWPYIVMA